MAIWLNPVWFLYNKNKHLMINEDSSIKNYYRQSTNDFIFHNYAFFNIKNFYKSTNPKQFLIKLSFRKIFIISEI